MNHSQYDLSQQMDDTNHAQTAFLLHFQTLIEKQKDLNDLVWTIVSEIHMHFGFNDCVIYLHNNKRNALIQVAAYGAKKTNQFTVKNPIRIEPGEGIVGQVYLSGTSRNIGDTSKDSNYIIDDQFRLSELSIPIIYKNTVLGVIDSEHPRENFYTKEHQSKIELIASLTADKIMELSVEI